MVRLLLKSPQHKGGKQITKMCIFIGLPIDTVYFLCKDRPQLGQYSVKWNVRCTFNITCKFLWSPHAGGKHDSIMTHAITAYAGVRRRSERRRHEYMCGKFLHNAIARFARVEICLGCWRGGPFLNCTHLGHRRSCSDVKARGNTTGLRRISHPHWRVSLLQSSCRALGQIEASSHF